MKTIEEIKAMLDMPETISSTLGILLDDITPADLTTLIDYINNKQDIDPDYAYNDIIGYFTNTAQWKVIQVKAGYILQESDVITHLMLYINPNNGLDCW